jgi:hypothetical protein
VDGFGVSVVIVTAALPDLTVLVSRSEASQSHVLILGGVYVLEDLVGVQEPGVDVLRRLELLADNERLGGNVTRGGGLRSLDLLEELVENPKERVVVLGAEDLGDKSASRTEELNSKLEGAEDEPRLGVSVLLPGGTHVGRTIVHANVQLPALEILAEEGAAVLGRDIGHVRLVAGDRLDGVEVDTDDEGADGHGLNGDLSPTTRGSAEIKKAAGVAEEAILVVQVNQLEGGAGAVSMFLGKMVVLVKAALKQMS